MNSDLSSTRAFNHFLSRNLLGRVLHACINLLVVFQFCSPPGHPTWAADTVVNALHGLDGAPAVSVTVSTLSLVKNKPLGNALVVDGYAVAPDAGPLAMFTWFGPFAPVTGSAPDLVLPEGHST